MALSAAACVNEKLYHVSLLLQLADQTDHHNVVDAARHLALQHAAVNALYTAFQLFLQEVAESVKLRQPVQTLAQLREILQQDGRSHAVPETLNVLAAEPQSWLSALFRAQQGTLFADVAERHHDHDPLAVKVISDSEMATADILSAFQQFVLQQRDYLQEW